MALTKISTGGVKDDAASQAIIADEAVDEARLQISNAGSNGQFLSKQSGNTGGLTWADGASEGTEVKSTGESGTTKFLRVDGDGTSSWQVPPDTVYTHPNHSGEVTSTADGAQVIASNVVDEDNLKVSNSPTNGQVLSAQSGNTGGLTWTTISASPQVEGTALGALTAGQGVSVNSSGQFFKPAITISAYNPADTSTGTNCTIVSSDAANNQDPNGAYASAYDPVSGKMIIGYVLNNAKKWRVCTATETDTVVINPDTSASVVTESGVSTMTMEPVCTGENTFLVAYNDGSNKGKAQIFKTGGTDSSPTLTAQGSELCWSCGVSQDQHSTSGHMAHYGNGKVLITYYNAQSETGYYVLLQVASNGTGTTVSKIANAAEFAANAKLKVHGCGLSNNKYFSIYKHPSNGYMKYRLGTVGSTSVSWSGEGTFLSTNWDDGWPSVIEMPDGKIVVIYAKSGVTHYYKVGTISGTDITWGSETALGISSSLNSSTNWALDAQWDPTTERIAIAWSRNTGSADNGYLTWATYSSGSLTIAGNITGGTLATAPDFNRWGTNAGQSQPYATRILVTTKTKNIHVAGRVAKHNSTSYYSILVTNGSLGTSVTDLTANSFVGLSNANYTNGQTAKVDVQGGTNTSVSGLTPGNKYYLKGDGTLVSTAQDPNVEVGLALTSTKLLIKG